MIHNNHDIQCFHAMVIYYSLPRDLQINVYDFNKKGFEDYIGNRYIYKNLYKVNFIYIFYSHLLKLAGIDNVLPHVVHPCILLLHDFILIKAVLFLVFILILILIKIQTGIRNSGDDWINDSLDIIVSDLLLDLPLSDERTPGRRQGRFPLLTADTASSLLYIDMAGTGATTSIIFKI